MIDIFNNFSYILNNKKSKIIIVWIIFLFIILILFLIIGFKYKYNKYDTYLGHVEKIDENYFVVLYVLKEKINSINSSRLLIDKEEYNFEIKQISNDYYNLNNNLYLQIVLNLEMKEEWLIENNIINLVFENEATTIFEEIKKGFNLWKN